VRDLPALLDQTPGHATVVVTHSATLAYLEQDEGDAFLSMLAGSGVHRLGAEGPAVLPQITEQISEEVDIHVRS
jgi:4-aminobutyrate aminotransferase-like enzyme